MMGPNNIVALFPGQLNAADIFSDNPANSEIVDVQEFIMGNIAGILGEVGLDYRDHPKDFCLILEAASSFALKCIDQDHPLQTVANLCIEFSHDGQYVFTGPKTDITN